MSTVNIIVLGATGRMGRGVLTESASLPWVRVAAAVSRRGVGAGAARVPTGVGAAGAGGGDAGAGPEGASFMWKTPDSAMPRADVVIDFSAREALGDAVRIARESGAALLTGVTGHSAEELARLREASGWCAVLVAPNTSLGVAVMAAASGLIARLLGPGYRASIVEAHHAGKRDAPSGTAKRLAEAVRGAGGELPEDQVLALRGGDVIGEHTVRWAGAGEYVELTHRATTRGLFARGALHAARWLKGRGPGWYTMNDCLGIEA